MKERITVVGNVASAPELRRLPNGDPVTSFRLAVTERRQDRESSAWVDGHTSWYKVNAFRGLGENAHRSLHVGDRVIASGRFTLQEWENDTKRGVTAAIDAEALGPDLLWGTTVYRRASAGESAPAAEPPAARTDTPDEGAGWAAPGTAPDLVAAGETPF